jgi:transglutaminase-like putative cysteine protease
MLWGSIVVDASNISIDSKSSRDGTVTVSYAGINRKTKVMVEKGATKYYYDLKSEKDTFPLQMGNGEYTVAILENTSGTSYKVLEKKSFKAEISEENSVYLNSTQPITWDEDMEAVKLAALLTEDMEDSEKIVQTLFDYTVNNIDYDYSKVDKLNSDYFPDVDTILEDGKGICYDYSVLFGVMARSQGIPTKLIKGYRAGMKDYHAWNEVYFDGSWKVVDTTYSAWSRKARTSSNMYQNRNEYQKLKEY